MNQVAVDPTGDLEQRPDISGQPSRQNKIQTFFQGPFHIPDQTFDPTDSSENNPARNRLQGVSSDGLFRESKRNRAQDQSLADRLQLRTDSGRDATTKHGRSIHDRENRMGSKVCHDISSPIQVREARPDSGASRETVCAQ